jgi:3-carboxy-cis,cis-muconate cycloisomerase
VAELGAALAIAAGAVEKVALDVILLSQTEVGEVAEESGGGRGGSSAMAHKHNPVGSIRARAAARSVRAAAGVLLEAMAGEHERAAGAWHSEWQALSEALAGTGGAAWSLHEALAGLTVDAERMRANLSDDLREVGTSAADAFIDRALELQ